MLILTYGYAEYQKRVIPRAPASGEGRRDGVEDGREEEGEEKERGRRTSQEGDTQLLNRGYALVMDTQLMNS